MALGEARDTSVGPVTGGAVTRKSGVIDVSITSGLNL